ncbi:MAG: CBS domain-containing protein [Myxococcota bacterium]|nr:CBS domain-containing protein [Myxococcota bacterium]
MTDKKVKDLMLPLSEYATISGERTIQEALNALDKAQLDLTDERHHHRSVLVLDEAGEVVGKLSHWAILRKLEPKFLKDEDLAVISGANVDPEYIDEMESSLSGFVYSLTALCKRASGIKAKDAMVPMTESIDEEESLLVAVHQFVVSHAQSMLVTRECRSVGTLRLSDVFEAVADIIRSSCDIPSD